ncbi:competence damage-inducible protein A [Gloeomargarita lithophora Alchichica-D10]|uniref:CinA-like protein n=1 Tax=Gloeomargarita lithophora Alchichica-D10 TaxID=1188229 RepID=A0A1J0AES3_9CYAN|nr:competence/damage-inducible protein A [Gloeomargarita lithophora]APB34433.1 competence damage-inducible protein A [Gloeomargarita lithophora Alchichica-D10]
MPLMTAEVLAVGTELLLGEIVNTNAQFFAQELAALGISHHWQTVVGDNVERIHQGLAQATARSQLVLCTGGLGPTPDDLTTEAIAGYFQTPLVEHPQIFADIQAKYARRGLATPENNRKQALLPQGAEILPNPKGTAPGMIWSPRPDVTVMTFPGVPSELQTMWRETAVPYLQAQGWVTGVIVSQNLRFWGISEAALAAKVQDFFTPTNPTVAPYASKGETRLRITARAADREIALALIAPVSAQLQQRVGMDCYGLDGDTLAQVVGQLLQTRGDTLAVAESCTGGLLGAMITEVAGSSSYFQGGVVSYANGVKEDLLGVPAELLTTQGAVSAAVAMAMAVGVRERLATTWGLSITGIAGPGGGSEAKPVGLVYIALAGAGGRVTPWEHRFSPERGREWIRHLSANQALDHLRRTLLNAV